MAKCVRFDELLTVGNTDLNMVIKSVVNELKEG